MNYIVKTVNFRINIFTKGILNSKILAFSVISLVSQKAFIFQHISYLNTFKKNMKET